MKKIIIFLLVLTILVGNNVFAAEKYSKDKTTNKYYVEDSFFTIKKGYQNAFLNSLKERQYYQFPKNMKIGD